MELLQLQGCGTDVDVPQLQGCGTAPFAFQGSFLTPSGLPQAPNFDVRVILHGFPAIQT